MSAQGGILYFDGRPVPPEVIAAFTNACRPFGPDGNAEIFPSPGVALIHRRLQVTPEDHADRQPIALTNGSWLTWDGRLDNRTDLMTELGMRPSRSTPDAQVVAEACQRWRSDAFPRLIGDWALALWDPREETATLACDYMAVRPVFYTVTDSFCAWCTALEALVAITHAQGQFDDEYLQGKLMRTVLPGRTAYRNIRPLIGGHSLTLSRNGGERLRQFWFLPSAQLRYRDPRDYEVQFRTLFRQAVADRLRSETPIWLQLSGGLDSSSVVCMASRLANEGVVSADALTTTSWLTAHDGEIRFITAVEEVTQFPTVHVFLEPDAPPTFPMPVHMTDVNPAIIGGYQQMRAAGARVLVTGRLGDQVCGNFKLDLTTIAAALRGGRPVTLAKNLRAWGLASKESAWTLLYRSGLELLPERIQAWLGYVEWVDSLRKGGSSASTAVSTLPFKESSLSLVRLQQQQVTKWSLSQRQPWQSLKLVKSLAMNILTGHLISDPYFSDVCHTHPFTDRRLVEFVTAIDWNIVCPPGKPRALMRAALTGLLPEVISRRFSKGYAEPFAAHRSRELALFLSKQFGTLEVVERGYVEPNILRKSLELAAETPSLAARSLATIGAVEVWLRLARSTQVRQNA